MTTFAEKAQPLVSVIIPCYNCDEFILRAIDSVKNQTYKNIEIIVVEDGSVRKVKELISCYPEITYCYQENKGQASARNRGIKLSTGSFIAFLDADDVWKPQKIEMQIACMKEKRNIGLVHTNMIIISKDRVIERKQKIPSGNIFSTLLKENYIATSSVMIRRECFDNVGAFNEDMQIAEDYLLWLNIAHQYQCYYIDIPLIKYYIHNSNISLNYEKKLSNIMKLRKVMPDKIKLSSRQLNNFLASRDISISNLYFKLHHYKKALVFLIHSINRNPFISLRYFMSGLKSKLKIKI